MSSINSETGITLSDLVKDNNDDRYKKLVIRCISCICIMISIIICIILLRVCKN
jgi:hypothetical protein